MTDSKLDPKMVKAFKELHEEVMAEFDKPHEADLHMQAGGLIPTICDGCRRHND